MNRVITALIEQLPPILDQHTHPILGKPTFNIGFIEGGYRPNVVPDFCKIGIDRRLVPGESYNSAIAEIQEILDIERVLVIAADLRDPPAVDQRNC